MDDGPAPGVGLLEIRLYDPSHIIHRAFC